MTIRVNSSDCLIQIPIYMRCKMDWCNLYQLVLQNRLTKEVFVYKLRDFNSNNQVRYTFRFEIQDCMEYGEYTYYLIRNDEWEAIDINTTYVPDSNRLTDKEMVLSNNKFLIVGDKLVVLPFTRVKLIDASGCDLSSDGSYLTTKKESDDCRITGELETCIELLATGLFKYENTDDIPIIPVKDNTSYKSDARKTYKTYSKDKQVKVYSNG